jgi:hypothetical protein
MPGLHLVAKKNQSLLFYAEFAEKDTEAYRIVCEGCGEYYRQKAGQQVIASN